MCDLIGMTFAPCEAVLCTPHMTYLASVARNDRQHTFRTCNLSLRVEKQCHPSPEGWVMSQVDFRFRHMLSPNNSSSTPTCLSGRRERKHNFSIHTGFPLNNCRVVPQSLCRSGCRHPKCHCSWNTIKCFCSCCCPLKILAASMTAVKISQTLPFTCQQGLKIVQVASVGGLLSLLDAL